MLSVRLKLVSTFSEECNQIEKALLCAMIALRKNIKLGGFVEAPDSYGFMTSISFSSHEAITLARARGFQGICAAYKIYSYLPS